MVWHQRFFWLLLAFLPTQLGIHFWPEWAMVLGRRVDYLAPTIYLTDILVMITLGSWVLSKSKIQITYQKLITPCLGALFVIVNVLFATNYYVAFYKWMKVGEFLLLGWYIVRTKPSFSLVAFCLSLGVLYSSVLAIAQFALQHSVGGPMWWLGERTFDAGTPGIARFDFNFSLFTFHFSLFGLRPYATFPHPNVLGGFLAATLPIILVRLLGRIRHLGDTKKRENFFYGVTFAMGVVALVLTFSRSAIVVGGVAIVIAIARIKNTKTILLYSLFFILLLVSVIKTDLREESIVVRQQLNIAAVKLWATSPFLGGGLGNFLVRLPEALPTRTIYFLQPVHNIYLLLISEVGVVGLSVFLWLLWCSLQNFKFQISNFKLSLLVVLLLGLVDHYPLTLQQGQLLLTLLLGLAICERTHSGSTSG